MVTTVSNRLEMEQSTCLWLSRRPPPLSVAESFRVFRLQRADPAIDRQLAGHHTEVELNMAEGKLMKMAGGDVAETFADHCEQVIFDGQTLRVDMAVTRFSSQGAGKQPTVRRATACRLVLTPQAALQLHEQLQRIVAGLEQKGLVRKRTKAPAPATTQ